jgi:hypothetical protein
LEAPDCNQPFFIMEISVPAIPHKNKYPIFNKKRTLHAREIYFSETGATEQSLIFKKYRASEAYLRMHKCKLIFIKQ